MNIDVKFSETDSNFAVQFDDAKNPTSATNDHSQLINRDKTGQHPIGAITGLEKALDEKLNSSELPTAIDTALAEAKTSGAFDGKDGKDGTNGADGKSPYIAENGNWMIWDANTNEYVDTGISASQEERVKKNTEDIETLQTQMGDVETALDELHVYAQTLITGGASE